MNTAMTQSIYRERFHFSKSTAIQLMPSFDLKLSVVPQNTSACQVYICGKQFQQLHMNDDENSSSLNLLQASPIYSPNK